MLGLNFKVTVLAAFAMLLAVTAWYAGHRGELRGMANIQSQWDAEVAQMAEAQAEELSKALATTAELQARIEQQRRTHRNEIDRIGREHAAAIDSLRNRPEARAGAGGLPEGAAVGVGCTGEGLSAGDAAFLIRLAADAALTQSALQACQQAYNEVADIINSK